MPTSIAFTFTPNALRRGANFEKRVVTQVVRFMERFDGERAEEVARVAQKGKGKTTIGSERVLAERCPTDPTGNVECIYTWVGGQYCMASERDRENVLMRVDPHSLEQR